MSRTTSVHRAATDLAFLDLAGAAVNDFLPLRLGVSIHGVVEAGDELAGQVSPVRSGKASISATFSAVMLMRLQYRPFRWTDKSKV